MRIPHTAMADNVEPRMDLRLGGVVLIVSRGVLANKDDARGNVTQIKLFVDPQALTAKLLWSVPTGAEYANDPGHCQKMLHGKR